MVTGEYPQADQFMRRIREAVRAQSGGGRLVKVARKQPIYTSGERDGNVYFIESGHVKLVLSMPDGKECLLSICRPAHLFGELCLSGQAERLETAVAMSNTTIRRFPSQVFVSLLKSESLMDGFVRYLAARISEQQEFIATLTTLNSERRLARILIQLAQTLGMDSARGSRITERISHEELADMVGTTRTRIGVFLKRFQELGLVAMAPDRHLVVDTERLGACLECDVFDTRCMNGSSKSLPACAAEGDFVANLQ
jgi:CRP-like cAMP-binding protein